MITPRRLVQQAKKWQKMAALGKRRLAMVGVIRDGNLRGGGGGGGGASAAAVAGKGHCVVYAARGERFEVPLAYLRTEVFGELLRMSEDEFGFTGEDGRIKVPCDAALMEYSMSLLRRKPSIRSLTS